MNEKIKCPVCKGSLDNGTTCPSCKFNLEIYDMSKKISVFLYNKGLDLIKKGALLDAIAILERSLYFCKTNVVARNLLGIIYYQIGEVGESLKHWVISINLKKDDNPAGKYIEDMKLEKLLLERKNEAIKTYNEALQYMKQGNEDIAIIRLTKAVNLSPDLIKAHLLLTLTYAQEEENKEKARMFFDKAREVDHASSLVLYYARKFFGEGEKGISVTNKTAEKVSLNEKRAKDPKIQRNRLVASFISGALLTVLVIYLFGGMNKLIQDNANLTSKNKTLEKELQKVNEDTERERKELKVLQDEKKREAQKELFNTVNTLYTEKKYIEVIEALKQVEKEYLVPEDVTRIGEIETSAYMQVANEYYNEGRKLYNSSKNEESKMNLELAINYGKNESFVLDAKFMLGRIAENMGEADNAIKIYDDIIENYKGTHTSELAKYRKQLITGIQ